MKKIIITMAAWSMALLLASCGGGASSQQENTPANGDLTETFVEPPASPAEPTPEEKYQQEREKLLAEGWEEQYVENGPLPSCYNFQPKRGKLDNYLEVYVGSGTDVAIKLMNQANDRCIRYVFINSGSTYTISNIPEGKYYLKIAYGKNWLSKVENGQCVGKFIRQPLYEAGTDILDFNVQHTAGGYNVPSFRLQLDVVSTGIANSFDSNTISESEFNR